MKDSYKVQIEKPSKNLYLLSSSILSFEISIDLILKYKIESGISYSESKLNQIYNEQQYYWANQIAIKFINYKPRTEKQVVSKLKDNEFSENIIERSVNHLKYLDLINDLYYAEIFYNEKSKINNWSFNKIKNELYNRGINIDILDLDQSEIDSNDLKNAELILNKKLKYLKDKNKLKKHMISKGFRFDNINKLIGALSLD